MSVMTQIDCITNGQTKEGRSDGGIFLPLVCLMMIMIIIITIITIITRVYGSRLPAPGGSPGGPGSHVLPVAPAQVTITSQTQSEVARLLTSLPVLVLMWTILAY